MKNLKVKQFFILTAHNMTHFLTTSHKVHIIQDAEKNLYKMTANYFPNYFTGITAQ
jgi:hypothetical protein